MGYFKDFMRRFEFRIRLGKGPPLKPFPKEPSTLPPLTEIKSLDDLKIALQKPVKKD